MATTATYEVSGMTCDHCVRAVGTAIEALPGVTGATVDLALGAVTVSSEHALELDDVRGAVEEAGYQLANDHEARTDEAEGRHRWEDNP